MQKPSQMRRTSGARAIAIDQKVIMARYRLYLLVSLILTAALSLGLQIYFGR